jgi:hypothetical protein
MEKADLLYPFHNGLASSVCSRKRCPATSVPRSPALIRGGSLRKGMGCGHASEFSQTRKFMRTTNLRNPGQSGLKAFAYPTALVS